MEITNIYYILAMLILLSNVLKRLDNTSLKHILLDGYLYLMGAILVWGILSSIPSTQPIQSIKNILSVVLVFVIFYLIPRYFYSEDKHKGHLTSIAITMNIVLTVIGILNLLYFYELLAPNRFIVFRSLSNGPYTNPNSYGVNLMLALIMSNLVFALDDRVVKILKKHRLFIVYIAFSYLILIINLLASSSRASILGVAVAFIPIALKRKKLVLASLPVIGLFLVKNQNFINLFRKLESSGLTGRDKIWSYAFNEIIAKNPVLGIGSGAAQDYLYKFFGGLSVHNSYINTIMSIGFIGFLLWIGILWLIFYKAYTNYHKHRFILIFTLLGLLGYAFFEIGVFEGLALKTSLFWTFVFVIECRCKNKRECIE